MNKILNSKLVTAQKDAFSIQENLSQKETEFTSLKSKIAEVEHELASKVSELEYLKSEAISNPVLVLGGNDEKNMTKSNDISAVLQSRPYCGTMALACLGDESEIRDSISSSNDDTYMSSEESKI